jgi:hypothetical protein
LNVVLIQGIDFAHGYDGSAQFLISLLFEKKTGRFREEEEDHKDSGKVTKKDD